MAAITAELVKELREKTGAGMMDCKKALTSCNGDLEQAIDQLRKEGTVKAAKKAGRATSEGLVGLAVSTDKKSASLVELNCETDFVANTDQFKDYLNTLAERTVEAKPANLEALLALKVGDASIQDSLNGLIAKVGENMSIRRSKVVTAGEGEKVSAYVHAGSKIGVVIRVKSSVLDADAIRDVAMHVAAMNPRFVDRAQVPADVVAREKDIAKASPDLAGKPANIIEKILDGKVNRFFIENCLNEQVFIKDTTGKQSVGAFLKQKDPQAQIVEVVRFQVGEELSQS